jgi:hypothetical protein
MRAGRKDWNGLVRLLGLTDKFRCGCIVVRMNVSEGANTHGKKVSPGKHSTNTSQKSIFPTLES